MAILMSATEAPPTQEALLASGAQSVWPREPYKRLDFLEARDAALFSQRDREVHEVAGLVEDASTRIVLLHGLSGVGKSSIVNVLKPDANLVVGAISEGYGRGTHTTRASSLHHLGDGTAMIDTPGIRRFGLIDLTKSEVASYFPEFKGLQCRFRNCRHESEPGCAVLGAVESGAVDRSRFESYRRLMAEAEEG